MQFQSIYSKLVFVVGILWVFEGIRAITDEYTSLQHTSLYIHVVRMFDILNLLRGLFLFVILICKRAVWESIKSLGVSGAKRTRGPETEVRETTRTMASSAV
jgi:hypothetical protein